jgi:hypothetical protein
VLIGVGVVGWRREGEVKGEFEGLFSHVGNNAVEEGTGTLKARVGVDFNEPRFELTVNHEVKAKYFEVIHEIPRGDLSIDTSNCISAHFLHEWQDLFLEVVLLG